MSSLDCSEERVARLENEIRILRMRLVNLAGVVDAYLGDASKVDLLSEALTSAQAEIAKPSEVKDRPPSPR